MSFKPPNYYKVKPLEEEQKGMTFRRKNKDSTKEYFNRLNAIQKKFRKNIRWFARKGDARNNVSMYIYIDELRMLRADIVQDKEMLGMKLPIMAEIDEEIELEERIGNLAYNHQFSMQRHESGNDYAIIYEKLLHAIEEL